MPRSSRRRRTAAVVALAAFAMVCATSVGAGSAPRSTPAAAGRTSNAIDEARANIKHIVWITKENRSFDAMFGQFPGADGATTGRTCHNTKILSLKPAPDHVPDSQHDFLGGLISIDGGRMDCFNRLWSASKIWTCPKSCPAYLQYQRPPKLPAPPAFVGIPNYWVYAKRFQLADRFFTPIQGPSGPEHLWTIAGSSDRFVGHEGGPGPLGHKAGRQYCGNLDEEALSFLPGTDPNDPDIMDLEDSERTARDVNAF